MDQEPRTILHMDLDAFYCAVEELENPELKGKRFVVGGAAGSRGVVSSASYPARKFGVRSAMPTSRAKRLCPDLIVVQTRHELYSEYSRQVMDLLRARSENIEQISIDEAFLELPNPIDGESTALEIQQGIQSELKLPSSWGVASNKLVAKIASDLGKPEGMVVVEAGSEAEFLAPLPVEFIWGIGPKSGARLGEVGITTIGELADQRVDFLVSLFGIRGSEMLANAMGVDHRKVVTRREAKSISAEHTFARDIRDRARLLEELHRMSERVARRLRETGLTGVTIKLKLRWPSFETMTRQNTLTTPTDDTETIYGCIKELFLAEWIPGRPVRLLGVGVTGFGKTATQLELFDGSRQRQEALSEVVRAVRQKYGRGALRKGR